jgi:hypothetical protein
MGKKEGWGGESTWPERAWLLTTASTAAAWRPSIPPLDDVMGGKRMPGIRLRRGRGADWLH